MSLNRILCIRRLNLHFIVLNVLISAGCGQLPNDRKSLEEYMYDYYNYPQMHMYEESDDSEESENKIKNVINNDGFQHVTYVNNGAVISNTKSSHFDSTLPPNQETANPDPTVATISNVIDDRVQDNDYDDDENALFLLNPSFGLGNGQNKPENSVLDFDETLTGMMGALAEIQKKGDSMLGSIRRQKGVLDQLDVQVVSAEKRRQEAEKEANQLEEVKQKLESVVQDLENEREIMLKEMKQEEFQMAKIKTDLAPLLSEVTQRKSELLSFENSISTRKSELETYQKEIDRVTKDLSELKNVGVSIDGATSVATFTTPVLVVGLVISIIFNLLVGGYVITQLTASDRVGDRVSQFVGSADSVLADSITGLIDQFEDMGSSNIYSKISQQQNYIDDFRPSEQEYYSYSDLPRSYS